MGMLDSCTVRVSLPLKRSLATMALPVRDRYPEIDRLIASLPDEIIDIQISARTLLVYAVTALKRRDPRGAAVCRDLIRMLQQGSGQRIRAQFKGTRRA